MISRLLLVVLETIATAFLPLVLVYFTVSGGERPGDRRRGKVIDTFIMMSSLVFVRHLDGFDKLMERCDESFLHK